MKYKIEAKSKEQHRLIFRILAEYGYGWFTPCDSTEETFEKRSPFESWPIISFNTETFLCDAHRGNHIDTISLPAMIRILEDHQPLKFITIENFVDGYDATITKDEVKVGCQTISKEKVQELFTAFDMVQTPANKIAIHFQDQESYRLWLTLLQNLGYTYGLAGCIVKAIGSERWRQYPYLVVRIDSKSLGDNTMDYGDMPMFEASDFKAVSALFKNTDIIVEGVGEYSATVHNSNTVTIDGSVIKKEQIQTVLDHFETLK